MISHSWAGQSKPAQAAVFWIRRQKEGRNEEGQEKESALAKANIPNANDNDGRLIQTLKRPQVHTYIYVSTYMYVDIKVD